MEVISADATSEPAPTEDDKLVVPGPQSPLALLRSKRAEMDKGLFLDLAVPRRDEALGVRLWVRYKPGDPAVLASSVEKREKAHASKVSSGMKGDPDRMLKSNADFLVDACSAVYTLPIDEEPSTEGLTDGEYPTFSTPELSEALGAGPSAVETCRKLYATPGDLMVAANMLLDWSGKFVPKADKDFLGS
jgi:hypothetical protein